MPMTDAMPAGWYEDPWHGPGLRWWDGHQWTVHTVVPHGYHPPPRYPVATPASAPPPPRPGGPPWWVWTLAALGVIAPIAAFVAIIVAGVSGSTGDSSSVEPFTPTVASTPG